MAAAALNAPNKVTLSKVGGRLRILLPMESGPQDIRSLDGLRALAALMIVALHFTIYSLTYLHIDLFGDPTGDWRYFLTGVHLFFVLSGFLLFLPYARAMLRGQPLPSLRRFYQRRILRIVPAYWACLAVLAYGAYQVHEGPLWRNLAVHTVLIHDAFPSFNQAFEGPFWTLAVEAQFYLLLPLFAYALAKLVGDTRSAARLLGGLVGLVFCALVLRAADAAVMGRLPALSGAVGRVAQLFVLVTMGTQGKFIEVFALGMLCGTLYVLSAEEQRISRALTHRLSWALLVLAIVVVLIAAPIAPQAVPYFSPGASWSLAYTEWPLIVGLGYSALLLAILWGGRVIHVVFEVYPLRFIGLISYSLYLWHLPILFALPPFQGLAALPLVARLALAFLVAYLSYQFIERPFLRRRLKYEPKEARREAGAPASGGGGFVPIKETVAP